MSRLGWFAARLPVSLLVAGMRYGPVLPAAAGERPPRLPPPGAVALGLRALEGAAAAGARRLDDPLHRWRELGNKVRALARFRSAAEPAGVGASGPGSAADEVFDDLWRREGEGFLRGRQAAADRRAVAPGVARRDRLPGHTGLGLGLASYRLAGLRRPVSSACLGDAVERFLADCRRLASPGYEGAVVEALGLTVQMSHPRLLRRVDEALAARSEASRALFWHGVGRGLYFDPREMPPRPGGGWRAAQSAAILPPDDEARRNAVSGLAWAATLVNFRCPEIVAARLCDPLLAAAGDAGRDAATNGVASVTLLWLEAVGDDPLLRAFRAHWAAPGVSAEPSDETDFEPWRRRIGAAIESAIDRVYPVLVERNRIDAIFRYRPAAGWAESLGENAVPDTAPGREVPLQG